MTDEDRIILLREEAAREAHIWRRLQQTLEQLHDQLVPASPGGERLAAISAFSCAMLRLQRIEADATNRLMRLHEQRGDPHVARVAQAAADSSAPVEAEERASLRPARAATKRKAS